MKNLKKKMKTMVARCAIIILICLSVSVSEQQINLSITINGSTEADNQQHTTYSSQGEDDIPPRES